MRHKEYTPYLLSLLALLLIIPLLWVGLTLTESRRTAPVANVVQVSGDLARVERVIPSANYPRGELLTNEAREGYTDGELRLVVPRLGLDCQVLDGVDLDTLEQGVGLYDNAQLPSMGNPNVSIAGHRDVYGAPFLEIDKLCQGDRLYLVYGDSIYCYSWLRTDIIESNDWSVIHCADYSRITLTSCDPIGTTINRIVAIGKLEAVEPYSVEYNYK